MYLNTMFMPTQLSRNGYAAVSADSTSRLQQQLDQDYQVLALAHKTEFNRRLSGSPRSIIEVNELIVEIPHKAYRTLDALRQLRNDLTLLSTLTPYRDYHNIVPMAAVGVLA